MATLQIPTVTEEDLLDFHRRCFGRPFDGKALLGKQVWDQPRSVQLQHKNNTQQIHDDFQDTSFSLNTSHGEEHNAEEYYDPAEEEDDGLGYYADGVKRTLTDEQIAMFRHSEIQALLRERRHRLEADDSSENDDAVHSPQNSTTNVQPDSAGGYDKSAPPPKHADVLKTDAKRAREPATLSDSDGDHEKDREDEEEYARFLRAERLEFQRAAAAKRNGERLTYDPDDRTISTRRRVREMDDMHTTTDVLMYDDEQSAQPEKPDVSTELRTTGRKFWWPEIRPET